MYSIQDVGILVFLGIMTFCAIFFLVVKVYLGLRLNNLMSSQDITQMPPVRFYLRINDVEGETMHVIRMIRGLLPSVTLGDARYISTHLPHVVASDLTRQELNAMLRHIESYQDLVSVTYEAGVDGRPPIPIDVEGTFHEEA